MNNVLEECKLCPRKCKVNRINGELGFCKAPANPKIALADLHYFEEPCVSGETGSGTVFFTGCNLNCIYCQNYKISQEYLGKELTIEELAEEFLKLEEKGANNINLVTGFAFVPQIIEALNIAKNNGLDIPIVYNTSGYESLETLKLLDGYIDVYLPDFKYYYDELGKELSGVQDYFEIATKAIKEMIRQVGKTQFNENGMIKKGVIIRHLILPNHIQNSKMVLKWLKNNIPEEIFISVMAQYFPTNKANKTEDLNRKINCDELKEVEDYIYKLNIKNGYIQDLEENEEQYVPKF